MNGMKTLRALACAALMVAPAAALAQSGTASGGGSSPGTNSLGTAQSSGAPLGTGRATVGRGKSTDAVVQEENRVLDKKVKSICRGC